VLTLLSRPQTVSKLWEMSKDGGQIEPLLVRFRSTGLSFHSPSFLRFARSSCARGDSIGLSHDPSHLQFTADL